MADEKKEDKKTGDKKPAGIASFDATGLVVIGVLTLFVVAAIGERLYDSAVTGSLSFYGISFSGVKKWLEDNLPVIKIIFFTLSTVFIFGTIVFSQLRNTVLAAERKRLGLDLEPLMGGEPLQEKNPMANQWKQIVAHSESEHPSDWRLAIIECDIILSELLDTLNLPGDTMGDKMKVVEKSDFTTIDLAWEAHKIRNQVAHEGSEFLLNQRETRRVVDLYARVFVEFFLI